MSRKNESILEVLMTLPWWVSVVVSALVFLILQWVFPAFAQGNPVLQALAGGLRSAAGWFALIFLIPIPFSLLNSARRSRLFDSQSDIESVRALSWRDFELLVGEAFRRQGYSVEETGGGGADGGVDLVLRRQGQKAVVQCKRWRNSQVGVTLIRELFGVMSAQRANEAVFVSSGTYTADALAFAKDQPIRLIDGAALVQMIADVRRNLPLGVTPSAQPAPKTAIDDMTCPICSSPMVKRTAKAGSRAGQAFWGCSRFPACRGIRPVA